MVAESHLCIAANLENLSTIREFVRQSASAFQIDADSVCDVLLAVDEAATNIIVHGYRGCQGTIEIDMEYLGDSLVVRLRDEANPFDPRCVPAADVELPLEQRAPGGLGIHLMRRLVDDVGHCLTAKGGNELTLVKKVGAVL